MEGFEERKKEYLKGLNEHIDILVSIVNRENPKMKEIVLDPQNDNEINIAKATIQMIIDINNLVENVEYGMVKPIDMKSSYVVNLFIRTIKALSSRNQEDTDNIYVELKQLNIKDAAKVIYEMMVVFVIDPEETIEYIAKESGFDVDNEVDAERFKLYLDKANEITNKRKAVDTENIDSKDEKQAKEYIDFTTEFHRLCEEGKSYSQKPNYTRSRYQHRFF